MKLLKRCLLAVSVIASLASTSALAGGYNLYLALVYPSGQMTFYNYQGYAYSYNQAVLNPVMSAFMQNVTVGSADAQARIWLLQNVNLSQACGAVGYTGYGLNIDEAVASGRYREILRITC